MVAALVLLSGRAAAVHAAPKPTDTPSATIDPNASPTPTLAIIEATATPWVVIMVTPTPGGKHTPPSLQIADLPKKLRNGAIDPGGKLLFAPSLLTGLFADPSPVPAEVDDKVALFSGWLVERQREYLSFSRSEFAQMLPSHTVLPTDGSHEYPDGWFAHPTDSGWSWDDLQAIQFEPLPFAIQIDVYSGLRGPGYVSCFYIGVDGQVWERCVNYGPDGYRSHSWQVWEAEE
jgi:hypothetical protein